MHERIIIPVTGSRTLWCCETREITRSVFGRCDFAFKREKSVKCVQSVLRFDGENVCACVAATIFDGFHSVFGVRRVSSR